jgi:hypothetical protein
MSVCRFRWKIALLRIAGVTLCIVGLTAGYLWFYHWGPYRCVEDPVWVRQHTDAEYWEQYQACIRRSGWTHDGGGAVGAFGDKRWVQWIMDHVNSDDDLFGCDAGHKNGALVRITNQDAGSVAQWHEWWERNREKSQEEWIREGFRKHGVEVHTPLTSKDIVALLKLAGDEAPERGGVPYHVQTNACRWLCDSDFDPEKFTVKDISDKDANRVVRGLVRTARWSGLSPKSKGLGVLNLGEPVTLVETFYQPRFTTPRVRALANTVVFVPLCTGLLLLWLSFRSRQRRPRTIEAASVDV